MTYRVYLSFFVRGDGEWIVQFSRSTLDRTIGPLRVWDSPEIIRELIRRTPTKMDSEAKAILEHALQAGRGGMFLELLPEQYASLIVRK